MFGKKSEFGKYLKENPGFYSDRIITTESDYSEEIIDMKDRWLLEIDFPGVKKEDLSVEHKNDRILIQGNRIKNLQEVTVKKEYVLPPCVKNNVKKIVGNLTDGVLKLYIYKSENFRHKIVID